MPFNQSWKHIQIIIENEMSIKTFFYQSLQVYIIFIVFIFMKLIISNIYILKN